MSWPPGTIVVCVDDKGLDLEDIICGIIIEGNYYTIRETYANPIHNTNGVRLNEARGRMYGTRERGFRASRFRLAETKLNEIVMHHAKARP
jgi:hypothetical protein